MADAQTRVVITGDPTGAVKAIKTVGAELGALQAISAKAFALGGGFVGSAVVAGLVAITKQAIDAADALNEMAERTGLSVEALGRLQYAAKLSGVESDQLSKALQSLSVEIIAAGSGSAGSIEKFKSLGIAVRDTATKEIRPTKDVLLDVADAFALLPEGAARSAKAAELFGAKLGTVMIPFLTQGRAGIEALGDEIERLGGLMSDETAKAAAEFNDNLDRLKTLSSSAGIALANELVPALNAFINRILDLRQSKLSFADLLLGQSYADKFKTAAENVDIITAKIAELRREQAQASAQDKADYNDRIARQERLLDYYSRQAQRESGEDPQAEAAAAAKRIALQTQLQTKLADLERLRRVAAGQASADILLDEAKNTDARIKIAEKLRDAWVSALQKVRQESAKATEDAKALAESADKTRQAGADKAQDIRRGQMSESDQAYLNQRDATDFADRATTGALEAKLAAQHGRTDAAAKLAEQALKDAERASKYADKIAAPEDRAQATERIAEAQATAIEAQAKVKEKEAQSLDATAAKLKAQVDELDTQITDLKTKAAEIAVQVKIDEAIGAIAQIQQKLDALQDKTVTVTVNTVQTGDTPAPNSFSSDSNMVAEFARGGYTGPGGKWDPRGIVHAEEFVVRSEVVKQQGVLSLLDRLNRYGAAALPGFADGGLVGRLAIPSLRSPQPVTERMAATFNFPGLGSYRASLSADTFAQLQRDFQRAALQKGGRA